MPDPIDIETFGNPNPTPTPNVEPTGNPFLESVEESDRPIVEKYISEWDKQTTQKFQSQAEKYKPYEELGVDIDEIQSALQVVNFANNDPKGFYEWVQEVMSELIEEPGNNEQQVNLPEFEGVPEPFVKRYQALESKLEGVEKFIQEQRSSQEMQSQQRQLDTLLENMHNEHGDFDEPAVLGRIAQGMKPEDAIKDYNKYMERFSSPKPNAPKTLLNGSTRVDQVDSSKLSDPKTRKQLVTELLTNAAAANNS